MDEYLDDSDLIIVFQGVLAMITYFSMRTVSVLIEMELEREGLVRLPLDPIFTAARRL